MMQTFFHHAAALMIPVIFLTLVTVAWALIIFQIPGNWVALLLSLLYGWYEGFKAVSWWVLALGLVIAVIGEVAELAAGYMGAKTFGGRRMAGIAAIIGSIIGALLGAYFGWGVGAIPGSILGAFFGALLVEIIRIRKTGKAMKVGLGAGIGRAIGLATKMGLGAAFVALLYMRIIYTALTGTGGFH